MSPVQLLTEVVRWSMNIWEQQKSTVKEITCHLEILQFKDKIGVVSDVLLDFWSLA